MIVRAEEATVTVLYFAQAMERIGCDQERLSLSRSTDDRAVLRAIGERHPAAKGVLERSRLAVNQAFASGAITLRDGDELAVIPPVSGG